MEFRDLLKRRRMARHYLPEPVPPAVLERIVATVTRAPNAGFSQGQRLLVVTDPDALEALAEDDDRRRPSDVEPWVATAACARADARTGSPGPVPQGGQVAGRRRDQLDDLVRWERWTS